MADLMYTPLESIFDDTMKREGKTVSVRTSGEKFQGFMRRNDDGNNFENRVTLFYSISAPVKQGNIITYGKKKYILVNQETEENHCYYKSSALACNGVISLNNGMITDIPCYAYDINSPLVSTGQMISVINGSMEFITEHNALSDQLDINDTFNEFGRTFKISNVYYKDGILHIAAKVTIDEASVEDTETSTDKDISGDISDAVVKIEGADNIKAGYSRIYTAHIYDSYGVEIEGIWTFETSFNYSDLITVEQNDNKLKINVKDDDRLLGEVIILSATERNTNAKGKLLITIMALI